MRLPRVRLRHLALRLGLLLRLLLGLAALLAVAGPCPGEHWQQYIAVDGCQPVDKPSQLRRQPLRGRQAGRQVTRRGRGRGWCQASASAAAAAAGYAAARGGMTVSATQRAAAGNAAVRVPVASAAQK